MAAQFTTRRNPDTGRIEKIPEAEQEAPLLTDPEPETNPQQDAADAAFMARHVDDAPEEAPDSGEPMEAPESGAADAVQGAAMGARVAGVAGAAVGAVGGFLASKLAKPSPIGTLEGPAGAQETSGSDLAELLAVTKQIARVGTPLKNAVNTKAQGSRM